MQLLAVSTQNLYSKPATYCRELLWAASFSEPNLGLRQRYHKCSYRQARLYTNYMKDTDKEAKKVYTVFSHTKYGRRLANKARYDRFRPHGYSVKHWERLLGPDVNNLHHMSHTIVVSRWFIRQENAAQPGLFTRREKLLLSVTAALHDQAEAIVGDVPYGRKSEGAERREILELREHEAAFAPRLGGPALRLYRYGRDKIAFGDHAQKLPAAFKTIELIGFLENSLAAQRRLRQLRSLPLSSKQANYLGIHTEADRKRTITALERLSAEVLSNGVITQLIELGAHYTSAHIFLLKHEAEITAELAAVHEDTFDWYSTGDDPGAGPKETERHIRGLHKQKSLWDAWVSSRETN